MCEQLDGETKDSRRVKATAIIGDLGCEVDEISESSRFASWIAKSSSEE